MSCGRATAIYDGREISRCVDHPSADELQARAEASYAELQARGRRQPDPPEPPPTRPYTPDPSQCAAPHCTEPINAHDYLRGKRTCSDRCRQALHRARTNGQPAA